MLALLSGMTVINSSNAMESFLQYKVEKAKIQAQTEFKKVEKQQTEQQKNSILKAEGEISAINTCIGGDVTIAVSERIQKFKELIKKDANRTPDLESAIQQLDNVFSDIVGNDYVEKVNNLKESIATIKNQERKDYKIDFENISEDRLIEINPATKGPIANALNTIVCEKIASRAEQGDLDALEVINKYPNSDIEQIQAYNQRIIIKAAVAQAIEAEQKSTVEIHNQMQVQLLKLTGERDKAVKDYTDFLNKLTQLNNTNYSQQGEEEPLNPPVLPLF